MDLLVFLDDLSAAGCRRCSHCAGLESAQYHLSESHEEDQDV